MSTASSQRFDLRGNPICNECFERKTKTKTYATYVVPTDVKPHCFKRVCCGCTRWLDWVKKEDTKKPPPDAEDEIQRNLALIYAARDAKYTVICKLININALEYSDRKFMEDLKFDLHNAIDVTSDNKLRLRTLMTTYPARETLA